MHLHRCWAGPVRPMVTLSPRQRSRMETKRTGKTILTLSWQLPKTCSTGSLCRSTRGIGDRPGVQVGGGFGSTTYLACPV